MGYNSSTVFGKPGKDKDEWGVMDCVQGNFSVKDQLPDEDIGRSTRPGYRNVTTVTPQINEIGDKSIWYSNSEI